MKEIHLTRGFKAIVDYEDYEELNKHKWSYCKGYAVRGARIDGKWKQLLMHRVIMNLNFGDKQLVDHINGNTLDNRRCNLRICSNAQNCRNRGKQKNNTSGMKGVFKDVQKYKQKDGSIQIYTYWRAQIMINGKNKTLGYFPFNDEGKIQASQAYNQAAKEYFGKFAYLNN